MTQTFEILNFGHCDLFVICDLKNFILEKKELFIQPL